MAWMALFGGLLAARHAYAADAESEDDWLPLAPRIEQLDFAMENAKTPELVRPAGGSPLTFSIAASASLQSSGKHAFGATFLLQIPLERIRRPKEESPAAQVRWSMIGEDTAPKLKPPPRPKTQTPLPAPAEGTETVVQASPPVPDGPPPTPGTKVEPRSRFALPVELVRVTIQKALKHAHLEDVGARVDAMAGRARGAAALPELRLRVSRLVDESQELSPTEYDPHRTTASGGTSLWLEARASWRLDRLVFSDDETVFEKMRWERMEARSKLMEKVLGYLFAWQRAKAELEKEGLEDQERLALELRAAEAEISLDTLTGGWFGGKKGYKIWLSAAQTNR